MVLYLGNSENKKRHDEFQEKINSKIEYIVRSAETDQIIQSTPDNLSDIMMSLQYKIENMIILEDKKGVPVLEKYPWVPLFSYYNYTLSKPKTI